MITENERVQLDYLERRVALNMDRIKRLEVIGKLADSKEWEALSKEIKFSIDASEAQIKGLSEGSTELVEGRGSDFFMSTIRFWGGQVRAYKGVLSNVENAADKVSRINDEIANDRAQIKQIRDKTKNVKGIKESLVI